MSKSVRPCPLVSLNELCGHGLGSDRVQIGVLMDEKGVLMAVMLKAVNKRYIKGVVAHVDTQPELADQEQELEGQIDKAWSDEMSIEQFKAALREYYDFWLMVLMEFNATGRIP